MAKKQIKSLRFCTECGADSPKWEGRCPSCGQWNTMVEEKVASGPSRSPSPVASRGRDKARAVNDIQPLDQPRVVMPSAELNRVLGGGLVAGSPPNRTNEPAV